MEPTAEHISFPERNGQREEKAIKADGSKTVRVMASTAMNCILGSR